MRVREQGRDIRLHSAVRKNGRAQGARDIRPDTLRGRVLPRDGCGASRSKGGESPSGRSDEREDRRLRFQQQIRAGRTIEHVVRQSALCRAGGFPREALRRAGDRRVGKSRSYRETTRRNFARPTRVSELNILDLLVEPRRGVVRVGVRSVALRRIDSSIAKRSRAEWPIQNSLLYEHRCLFFFFFFLCTRCAQSPLRLRPKFAFYRLREPNTQDASVGAFQTIHHSTNQATPLDGGNGG